MMDTTPKYIKMCEKAGEIQKEWKLGEGDWVAMNGGSYTVECFNWNDADAWTTEELLDDKQAIWLPRQDQLQEMIRKTSGWNLMIDFRMWQNQCPYPLGILIPYSLEQLWLCFVMHEKYGKVWDDEKGEWNCPTNAPHFKQEKGNLSNEES